MTDRSYSPFRFKQFDIDHNLCAMKVGTDGVLLGAWANVSPHNAHVLDIGTGSGLIALMLAQRFPLCSITGIDIDPLASQQAYINASQSKFSHQIDIIDLALQDYKPKQSVDVVVCNPPFFESDDMPISARKIARQNTHLSTDDLWKHIRRIINPINGRAFFIIPKSLLTSFCLASEHHSFFIHKICLVRGNAQQSFKRVLVEFSNIPPITCTQINYLTIELERHQYTQDYQLLTKEFYLNFEPCQK